MRKAKILIALISITLLIGATLVVSLAHNQEYYTFELKLDMHEDQEWIYYPIEFVYDTYWTLKADAHTLVNVPESDATGWARVILTDENGTVTERSSNKKSGTVIQTGDLTGTTKYATCVVFTANKELSGRSVAHQQAHFVDINR